MAAPRYDTQSAAITVNPVTGLGGPEPLTGVTDVTYTTDVDRWPYVVATVTVANPGATILETWNPSLRPRPRILFHLEQDFATTQPGEHTLSDVTDYVDPSTPGNVVAPHLSDATPSAQPATLSSFDAALPGARPIVSSWGNLSPQIGGPSFTVLYNTLYIVDVAVDVAAGTVTITATSGEFLLDDAVALATTPYEYGSISLFALVRALVARVGGTMTTTVQQDTILHAPLTSWQPGQSISEFLEPILAAYSLRLYAESLTVFNMAWIGEVAGSGNMATIDLDYRSGMVNATYALNTTGDGDSGSWFDGAILIYSWDDAAGNKQTAVDRYPVNGVHTRALVKRISSPWPGPGAARGLVLRSLKRARTYTIDQVSNYYVRPGWDALLNLPDDADPAALKVTAVEWRYPAAEMTLTLQTEIGT